jgi:hypothetical protein
MREHDLKEARETNEPDYWPDDPTRIGSHYPGCWQFHGHHNCAVALVRALIEAPTGLSKEELAWLRSDAARLDWLEAQRMRMLTPTLESSGWRMHEIVGGEPAMKPIGRFGRTLRDAIDAAMADEPSPEVTI